MIIQTGAVSATADWGNIYGSPVAVLGIAGPGAKSSAGPLFDSLFDFFLDAGPLLGYGPSGTPLKPPQWITPLRAIKFATNGEQAAM